MIQLVLIRLRNSAAATFAAYVALAGLLSGCVGLFAVGGATAVGVTAAQERSIGDAVDDTGTTIAINQMLIQADPKLFRKVGVEVVEGRVLLTGSVHNPEDRIAAAKVTWGVKSVKEVINEIQVTDKSGILSVAKDSWISTQLRARLLGDRNIRDINYNIETVNGVIYLLGIAQDERELQIVTTHARSISGVEKVISHVWLKDDPRRKT